jgi:spermidine synthase
MSLDFAVLDHRHTSLGDLVLRRRRIESLGGVEVFEVKLGEAFLMSSLFHDVEEALSDHGLADLAPGDWDVVVGGLGLGYTAVAALRNPSVKSMLIVEKLNGVVDWHREGLVPLGPQLSGDPRCRFVNGDFFVLAASADGFDVKQPGRKFHAVLLDIDHSPRSLLSEQNAAFYESAGVGALADKLHPGGIFAMWSDDPPDDEFMRTMDTAFESARALEVSFYNPLRDCQSVNTVYVAKKAL